MKKDGFVANVVFGAKGERKQMGVCTLLWSFIFNLILLICSTAFWLTARLVLMVPMLLIGQRPDFGWVLPSKWSTGKTNLSQTYLSDKWRERRDDVLDLIILICAIALLGTFALIIVSILVTVLGHISYNLSGYHLTIIAEYVGKESLWFSFLHGIFVIAVIALAFGICFLVSVLSSSEAAELTGGWIKAKKDKVCPVVSFE